MVTLWKWICSRRGSRLFQCARNFPLITTEASVFIAGPHAGHETVNAVATDFTPWRFNGSVLGSSQAFVVIGQSPRAPAGCRWPRPRSPSSCGYPLPWLSQAERTPGFYFHIAIAHDQTFASSHLDHKLASLWHKYVLHLIALLILKPSLAVSLHLQKPSVAPCFSQKSLNLKRKGLCNLTSKATRLINLLSLNPVSYLFAFMSLSSPGIFFACLFV